MMGNVDLMQAFDAGSETILFNIPVQGSVTVTNMGNLTKSFLVCQSLVPHLPATHAK